MVLVFGLSVGSTLFCVFLNKEIERNVEYRMMAASKTASNLATLEELEGYRRVEDMELPSYKELRRKLLQFSREYDVTYAYYIRRAGENQLQYIVDNDFDETTRVGLDTPPLDIQSAPWIHRALEGETSHSGLGNYTPGWEGLLTTYTPLFDEEGNVKAVAGVDIVDKSIVFPRRMFVMLAVFQIVVVVIVSISGFITLIHYRIEAQEASEANAAKSLFLSNISHEFRTPLNSVLGMGELIRRTENLEIIKNYAGEIMTAGQSLLSMVNELIEYSKIGKKN
jgi:signal transduction histidine kinase